MKLATVLKLKVQQGQRQRQRRRQTDAFKIIIGVSRWENKTLSFSGHHVTHSTPRQRAASPSASPRPISSGRPSRARFPFVEIGAAICALHKGRVTRCLIGQIN